MRLARYMAKRYMHYMELVDSVGPVEHIARDNALEWVAHIEFEQRVRVRLLLSL